MIITLWLKTPIGPLWPPRQRTNINQCAALKDSHSKGLICKLIARKWTSRFKTSIAQGAIRQAHRPINEVKHLTSDCPKAQIKKPCTELATQEPIRISILSNRQHSKLHSKVAYRKSVIVKILHKRLEVLRACELQKRIRKRQEQTSFNSLMTTSTAATDRKTAISNHMATS